MLSSWDLSHLPLVFEKYIKNKDINSASQILRSKLPPITIKTSRYELIFRSSIDADYHNDEILLFAVFTRKIKFVEILINNGFSVDKMSKDKQTPLAIALQLVDKNMFYYLISRGADTKHLNNKDYYIFPELVRYGDLTFIETLVELGVEKSHLLLQMAKFANADFVTNNFLKLGYKLDQKNSNDSLFFHFICYYSNNSIELINLVKNRNPEQITKKNKFGLTGLAFAVIADDDETQSIFDYILGFGQFTGRALDQKAVFAIDKFCNNILHYSALNEMTYFAKNRINCILTLFPEAIRAKNCDGLTPLLFAARFPAPLEDIFEKIDFFTELDKNTLTERDYENNNIIHIFARNLNIMYKNKNFAEKKQERVMELQENAKFYFIAFCKKLLKKYPVLNLEEVNNRGQTPLDVFLDETSEDIKKSFKNNIEGKIFNLVNISSKMEDVEEIQRPSEKIFSIYEYISPSENLSFSNFI